jgi:chloramphenicol 3-O phosphotransferase
MSVIFLNGCTSAGKSSIAKSLQETLPQPHLVTGIDDAFAMLPNRMHNNNDGFYFDRDPNGLVRLNFGEFGFATLRAHQHAATALAKSGMGLILDEVLLSKELLDLWTVALQGLDVFWVGVHCDLDELERREIARGDRVPGQARGQFELVHRYAAYDLEVDTTAQAPAECALQISRAVQQRESTRS